MQNGVFSVPDISGATIDHARRHAVRCPKPAVDFFSGALLGNGGLGAVVTTRPDAVAVNFGHNNVWDIRVAENHAGEIGTFREIFERVRAIPATHARLEDDPWYRDYSAKMAENYVHKYPRPFPCGSLVLGFDRRRVEVLGHELCVATGVCRVFLLDRGEARTLRVFADMEGDLLWLGVFTGDGRPAESPFNRVRLLPDPDGLWDPSKADPLPAWVDFPADPCVPEGDARLAAFADPARRLLSFRQALPCSAGEGDAHPRDRAFRLSVRVGADLGDYSRTNWAGVEETPGPLERALLPAPVFFACVQLEEGLAGTVPHAPGEPPAPEADGFAGAAARSSAAWAAYWERSGVRLDDEFLEGVWYRNLYFLRCAVRPGVTCPGLFANWSYRQIGVAWHGDYHMNYNTQQPFWACFSSNHPELHLPYVDLVDHLLPVSRRWAREYYGLRGACFPHSAYPTEMSIMPYPVPNWGWEICETPWTVQSLWWHYLYTRDAGFLRDRAFGPIKEAVLFLVDYLRRPEARGAHWGDDHYHVFPTVPPELYGLRPGFRFNHDCLVDLTLIKFVFGAFAEACAILGREAGERDLLDAVAGILAGLPPYATAPTASGEVFLAVPGESPETVYNVPANLMTVFPGEEHGLHSPPEEFALAANSYRHHRTEGGNELVFLNLLGARLGLLDLERFKRQIGYCLLPNGTCADMALQVHGRYNDATPFDFMAAMGIWFENFALPAVINECLLQSYRGPVRLFPNWPLDRAAAFRTLRANGAFLVSASCADGAVQHLEVLSEAGGPLRILVPWEMGARVSTADGERQVGGGEQTIPTRPGETLRFRPVS